MLLQSGDAMGRSTIRVQLETNPMIGQQGQKVENGWIELREGTTVGTLLGRQGLKLEEVRIIAIVNGRVVSLDTVCFDGDRVAVLPQIGGG